ncbi:hypothetical protein D3C72_2484910 [compost metagenome]
MVLLHTVGNLKLQYCLNRVGDAPLKCIGSIDKLCAVGELFSILFELKVNGVVDGAFVVGHFSVNEKVIFYFRLRHAR